jgi:hypothetical protein
MSKTNKTGRSSKALRHVRLYHWMTDSPAWHDLTALERAIYADIAKLYDGANNGKIWYSVRTAADEFKVGKSTAWRAIQRLIEHGFLVQMKRGAFSLKQKHATEWRLTEFPCDVTHDIASKDFMRWKRPSEIQNAVSPQTSSVPVAKPGGSKMALTVPVAKPRSPIFPFHGFTTGTQISYQVEGSQKARPNVALLRDQG